MKSKFGGYTLIILGAIFLFIDLKNIFVAYSDSSTTGRGLTAFSGYLLAALIIGAIAILMIRAGRRMIK